MSRSEGRLFCCGLAGALAMLLLAPQSGKVTRAKLQRQSHKLRKQTAETVEAAHVPNL